MSQINFNDLQRQQESIRQRINERFSKVLNEGRYIMGPEIDELEEALAKYTGAKHVVSCASGTAAIEMGLRALGIGPGDAVLTSPFTFIATAGAIALVGAEPFFADIERDTYNLDPSKLEEAMETYQKQNPEKKVKAILAVDLFGQAADYLAMQSVADKYGLHLLEDAAQSFGGSYQGKRNCNVTAMAMTSFFPAKPLGCYGDGGAVFCASDEVYDILTSVRIHGQGSHKYDNVRLGLNGRLDTLQAAVLLEKLPLLDREREAKEKLANSYSEALQDKFVTPKIREGYVSAWAQYSLLSKKREAVLNGLRDEGIPTAIYYPTPLHLQGTFRYLGYEKGAFPVAEEIAEQIFSIPMHAYLTDEERDRIVSTLRRFG